MKLRQEHFLTRAYPLQAVKERGALQSWTTLQSAGLLFQPDYKLLAFNKHPF